MDLKDKVSIWAGMITLAVLQVEDRVDTELNVYLSGGEGAIGAVIGYVVGFVIVYFITRWLLERYFRGIAPEPSGQQIPRFETPR